MNDEREGLSKVYEGVSGISGKTCDFVRAGPNLVKYGNCMAGDVAARSPKDCGAVRTVLRMENFLN